MLFAVFGSWYGGSGAQPLSKADAHLLIEQCGINKTSSPDILQLVDRLTRLEDSGESFLMLNLVKLRPEPLYADPTLRPSWVKTSRDADMHYASQILPDMLRRAGHPVFLSHGPWGPLLVPAEAADIETNWADWDYAALVRYRSRRDFLGMICDSSRRLGNGVLAQLKHSGVGRTYVLPLPSSGISHVLRALLGMLLLAALRCMRCLP